jgi:hypothetical protein
MAFKNWLFLTVAACVLSATALSQGKSNAPASSVVPKGAKVFVATMDDGFDTYLKAALQAKKVPVVIVEKREDADFELAGHSDTQKASTAKKVIMWDWHSNEQASVQLADIKEGTVAWAYSANKKSSVHGKRSTAEACAKHLKEKIESGK